MVRALTGVVGVIRWGYYNAVAVEGYTITRTGGTYTLVARVVPGLINALNLSMRPLVFVTPFLWEGRQVEWTWPILEDCTIREGEIRVRVGAPDAWRQGGDDGLPRGTAGDNPDRARGRRIDPHYAAAQCRRILDRVYAHDQGRRDHPGAPHRTRSEPPPDRESRRLSPRLVVHRSRRAADRDCQSTARGERGRDPILRSRTRLGDSDGDRSP